MSKEPTPWKDWKEPHCLDWEPSPRGGGSRTFMRGMRVCPHAWQPLSWFSMTPWSCFPASRYRCSRPGPECLVNGTQSPTGMELLTMDVKSCGGIRSTPMDTSASPFHPRVRTVGVCSVGATTEAQMKSYGLAAVAPLATARQVTRVYQVGERRPSPQRTFKSNSLPEWTEEFSEFVLLTVQQHADVRTKCTLIKKSCKKKFLQGQVKTAIKKSSKWGDFQQRQEQMYPVYDKDLSVGTKIEESP